MTASPDSQIAPSPNDPRRDALARLTPFGWNGGMAIILISSEMPELIGMCDRMYVMAGGQITGELDRAEFSQETIMRYAMNMARKAV